MAIIKKTDNKRWQGCGERGAHMRCWWERKVVQPPMETSMGVSESTENVVPCDQAIYASSGHLSKEL